MFGENGWVYVYKWSGCGFESYYSQLNFRYRPYFEQGVPWHSGNRVYTHPKTYSYVTWQEHTVKYLCFAKNFDKKFDDTMFAPNFYTLWKKQSLMKKLTGVYLTNINQYSTDTFKI